MGWCLPYINFAMLGLQILQFSDIGASQKKKNIFAQLILGTKYCNFGGQAL